MEIHKLNIGCGTVFLNPYEWLNIDMNSNNLDIWAVDIEHLANVVLNTFSVSSGVENSMPTKYVGVPLVDNFTFVKAHHILEHVTDLVLVMRLLHSMCKNDATIDILVPLAHSLWDVANPTHKIRFNHRTFTYFDKDYTFPDLGLFQKFSIVSQHLLREPDDWFEGISWQVANLHVILKVVK